MPITLFTDLPRHALCRTDRFDAIEAIEGVNGLASGWAEGQLNRLRCLPRTPYRRTLHLDTDTRVLTEELPWLFSLLDDCDVGLVETVPDASYSRQHFGQAMYSAGFVLYRRNERVWAWLEAWEAVSERNFRWAGATPLPQVPLLNHVAAEEVRRRLLFMDQTSLVEILSPESNQFGMVVKTLDYCWNHSGSRQPRNNRTLVKILHSQALKSMTHPDILALAYAWRQSGRLAQAQQLYDYLASRYPEPGEAIRPAALSRPGPL